MLEPALMIPSKESLTALVPNISTLLQSLLFGLNGKCLTVRLQFCVVFFPKFCVRFYEEFP